MNPGAPARSFYIGWDVGGWNCDKNGKSRDAIVILDDTLNLVGKPWRGNLRQCITYASETSDWLRALFGKCQALYPDVQPAITMAIDTPLGFPESFVNLITGKGFVEADKLSGQNRYLFRQTERHLHQQGLAPLSAIKDMLGSQATKGMHALAKFAPITESCGVWTEGAGFRAIETYPAACRKSKAVSEFLSSRPPLGHEDKDDARICALIAYIYATNPSLLTAPPFDVPAGEGWIWIPGTAA